jgi:asparagine synthase (glutamine-hydrolysing)
MSVQAGIWNFTGKPVDRKLLAEFSKSLQQQGPDGEFFHVDGPIALIYRPFHTTTESRQEKQPFFSRRGYIVTWDGRLDNRDDLIVDLHGDVETKPTDVAIVAAAFDRWDTDCFRLIIGDWAVSIWKPEQRELLFAGDYMGIRHIFYYLKNDRIWWSSDISPLLLYSGDRFQVDDDYIAGYFAHDPDANLTPYRGIREVPAGQFVRIRIDATLIERFWRVRPSTRIRYKTDREYEEHFRHLFRQSVRRRLRSDSPVLAELSGGLDSSSIVCMADNILADQKAQVPRLDTISYYDNTEPDGDDSMYFRRVEEKRGRTGTHIDGSMVGALPASLQCAEFHSLPGALGIAQEPAKQRAAAVRDGGYRAVLSGIGGDEFMGGVPDPRAQLADLIVQLRLVGLSKQLNAWSLVKRRPWIQLLWQSAIDLLPPYLGRYLAKEAKVEPWIRRHFATRTKLSIRRMGVDDDFGFWLPTRRSCIYGVLSMARKMAKYTSPIFALEEARYPYLDQNLIEFILSIPASQMLRPGDRRSLMRRSLTGMVPQEILLRRTKQVGARTPILILDKHWDELQIAFQQSLSAHLGYVDEGLFLKTISDARAGRTVPLVKILSTISLEYWLRALAGRGLLEALPPSPSLVRQHALKGDGMTKASNRLPYPARSGRNIPKKGAIQ